MKKADYISHYQRKNKMGKSQLTDGHILMVNPSMKDNEGDPVYKPFLRRDGVISTAKEAGWMPATKGLDPTEIKKPVVIRENETVVNKSDYEAFLAFQEAKKRKNNPEYTTEEEIAVPSSPFDNIKTEVKVEVVKEEVAVPVSPFTQKPQAGIDLDKIGSVNPPKKVTKLATKPKPKTKVVKATTTVVKK